MRRVAGVSPLNASVVTWVAALAVVAVSASAALYVADTIVAADEPAKPRMAKLAPTLRLAAIAPAPLQIPNRPKKQAREPFKQARLAPEIGAPKPEPSKPGAERRAPQNEAEIAATPPSPQDEKDNTPVESGRASWYALPGPTASGERMNANALTAAHPTLPFGSKVKVVNLANGREIVVRINDRGPFAKNRIIDLSKAAAAQLGMIASGVARVKVSPVEDDLASNDESEREAPQPVAR
jgi:rare lipoprotein A